MNTCTCGHEATLRLPVHYRYPRREYLPEAMDPQYVHGGGYNIFTCGNPQCEADAFLACRERIIGNHTLLSWLSALSAEQAAALDLEVLPC
jgi:hypothetical protein